jgi:hypothetical protein
MNQISQRSEDEENFEPVHKEKILSLIQKNMLNTASE